MTEAVQTYTITTISLKQREEMFVSNAADLISEDACGKTFTGFVLIDDGSEPGGYLGVVNGEEVIFYEDEVQDATLE